MNFFKRKQKLEKEKEIVFDCIAEGACFTLENQDALFKEINQDSLLSQLELLYDHANDFVILTAPKAMQHVRYLQAAMCDEDVDVQIGIEKEKGCYLSHMLVDEFTCSDMFLDFYAHGKIPDLSKLQPVEFL